MGDLIRKILQSIVPMDRKSIWTKNENDLIELFKRYFFLNQTTKHGVEKFLRNNQISFEVSKQNTLILSPIERQEDYDVSDEIHICLPGPSIWEGLLPYGSQYHVRFYFIANVLYKINATLVVYHF